MCYPPMHMKTKTIKQTMMMKASAHDIYEALMDSRKHAKFTNDRASISRKVGGKLKAYGTYIQGRNLELVADKKIVQSWWASGWPEGHVSEVTVILTPMKGKTKISFTHKGIPEDKADSVKKGWVDYYWTPLKKFVEKEV